MLSDADLDLVSGGDMLNWLPSDGDELDSYDSPFCYVPPVTVLSFVSGAVVVQSPDALPIRVALPIIGSRG